MLSSIVVAALSFQVPHKLTRREIFTTAAAAATFATPLSAVAADFNAKNKAMATYGQRILALQGASAEAILDDSAALKVFASQMARASGKRNMESRRMGGTPLADAANAAIAAAASGDKAGANAAIADMISIAKVLSWGRARSQPALAACPSLRLDATRAR